MNVAEAIDRFAEQRRHSAENIDDNSDCFPALTLLKRYQPSKTLIGDLTPSMLREFASRWYVEKRGSWSPPVQDPQLLGSVDTASAGPPEEFSQPFPDPFSLLDELRTFFEWLEIDDDAFEPAQYLSILSELRNTLPRALEINQALSKSMRDRKAAFSFPEFLTSFESGGGSQYDIDAPGNVGAIDGYFRIIRADGVLMEGQELVSDERFWPIIFPAHVASMVDDNYVINLEIVRDKEAWQIAGCGFTYPPGTEF